jgi:hypothetical protein
MSILLPSGREFSPLERLVRTLALFGVFALVIWAFWKNTDRTITRLEQEQTVYDPADTLSSETRDYVAGFSSSLKDRYGMEFRLQVVLQDLGEPEPDAKTLFLGLALEKETARFRFPPMMARALGEDFTSHLANEHFDQYWANGNWEGGLAVALAKIWDRLDRLEQENADGQ